MKNISIICLALLALSTAAFAQSQDLRLHLQDVKGKVNSGLTLTVVEEYPDDTRYRRIYVEDGFIRSDTIVKYEAGAPLQNPQVAFDIYQNGSTRTGAAKLEGIFSNPSEVLDQMVALPSPTSRSTISEGRSVESLVLKLYGYGSTSLTDIVERARNQQIFEPSHIFVSERVNIADERTLDLEWQPGNLALSKVTQAIRDSGGAIISTNTIGESPDYSNHDRVYNVSISHPQLGVQNRKIKILNEEWGAIPDRVKSFQLSESSRTFENDKVFDIVQGQKVLAKDPSKAEKVYAPLIFALVGAATTAVASLTIRAWKRR
ncbi:MAG: hypothetical protein KDC26_09015 [Armatimonadetes bacterium]|nr:hypothetical protein [Armatimonadota bacterium]